MPTVSQSNTEAGMAHQLAEIKEGVSDITTNTFNPLLNKKIN